VNLTDYVKTVSIEDFGKSFKHKAQWNTRLRSTGGRFFPKDGHLDFNPKVYQELGLEVFRKIVRHELCHYHLYFEGKGYQHKDLAFKWGDPNGLHFGKVWLDGRREPKIFSREEVDDLDWEACVGSIVYNRILEEKLDKQMK